MTDIIHLGFLYQTDRYTGVIYRLMDNILGIHPDKAVTLSKLLAIYVKYNINYEYNKILSSLLRGDGSGGVLGTDIKVHYHISESGGNPRTLTVTIELLMSTHFFTINIDIHMDSRKSWVVNKERAITLIKKV